jgi:hypothetical protein
VTPTPDVKPDVVDAAGHPAYRLDELRSDPEWFVSCPAAATASHLRP